MEFRTICFKYLNALNTLISTPNKFHPNYGFATKIKFQIILEQITLVNHHFGCNLKHKHKDILRSI